MPDYHYPTGRARRIVSEDDCEPERRLWLVVVACASKDNLLQSWSDGDDQERDAAPGSQEWTRCGCVGECFRLVVGWAGLRPAVVRENALAEGKSGRRTLREPAVGPR